MHHLYSLVYLYFTLPNLLSRSVLLQIFLRSSQEIQVSDTSDTTEENSGCYLEKQSIMYYTYVTTW
jgi:hypothetical protein